MATAVQMPPSELKGRKLGRVLTKMGKVTREQVHEALSVQKTRKVPIGQLLTELGYCTEGDVAAALAGQAGLEFVHDLATRTIPDEVIEAFRSPHLWKRQGNDWVLRHPVE